MSLPPHQRYLEKPFFGSSHFWAQTICHTLPTTVSVLDIGSGSGLMGKALREYGFKEISAVEIDAVTRERTKEFYNEIAPSIDAFKGKTFGLILLLDVLEHMTAPDAFLEDLLPLVAPGGTLLISVPNVAHWSVRFPLMFGYFKYTERGILDKTHHRFYTRSTFRMLLGLFPQLQVQSERVSIPPLEFVLPHALWNNFLFRVLTKLHFMTAQIFPGMFGYQLLTIAKKKE